jgi:hypothetical protein
MSLKGSTKDFPLDTLIRLLADTHKTGELSLRGAAGEGALGIADGRVVTAVFADEAPIPALGAIFDMGEADFEFTPWSDTPTANLEGELGELLRKAEDHRKWLASVREVIPNDRVRFRLSERAAEQGAVTFTSDRWRVVLAVNGARDVNGIAEHLHVDRNAALDLLAGLVRDGVIETLEAPAETWVPEPIAPEPVAPPPPPMFEREPPAPPVVEAPPVFEAAPPPPVFEAAPPPPVAEAAPEPMPAPPAPQDWSAPAEPPPFAEPQTAETPAPPPADAWGPGAPTEPEPAPPPMDDRLAALFGNAPAAPAAEPPAPDHWTAPAAASDWTTPAPAAEQWTPPAEIPPAPADDPRLGALFEPPAAAAAPPAPAAVPPPPAAPSTPNEWAPPPTIEAPAPQKKGIFGRFRREEVVTEQPAGRPMVAERGAASRTGLLAAFSNALLNEYNSGQYGKNRIDDRIPSLLMRVDEQADPIDRPLPVVDDRLDVQALERVSLPETQAVPYLALLVSTIYGDAEKAFGRDKAKRGYRAAQTGVFGADASALGGSDLAGKLPKV